MSHFDILEVTDVLGVSTDELGDIVVDLDVSQDEGIDGARFRQALGVRSNPNPKHDLDAVFARTGNEAEVFFISDADVTEALEKVSPLKADETQLYSTGNKPRAISVTDAGIGMTRAEVDRVFDRFWRADPARKRTTGGTGLGLAISLEDTQLHGGWLQVWAKPNEGASFRLTLPRRQGMVFTQSPLPLPPRKSLAEQQEAGEIDE